MDGGSPSRTSVCQPLISRPGWVAVPGNEIGGSQSDLGAFRKDGQALRPSMPPTSMAISASDRPSQPSQQLASPSGEVLCVLRPLNRPLIDRYTPSLVHVSKGFRAPRAGLWNVLKCRVPSTLITWSLARSRHSIGYCPSQSLMCMYRHKPWSASVCTMT